MSSIYGRKIAIYSDARCTKEVDTIGWSNKYILNLINGEKEEISNAVKAGDIATATVWLKNLTAWRFGINEITHPDKRIKFQVESSWLGVSPVKLTVSFKVPTFPTPNDVIKPDKIEITGEFIYGGI